VRVINARNVNDALAQGLRLLRDAPIRESRNGPVRVSPCPVTTVYERPWERVLVNPVRDANPFFHLVEAMWMLGGRSDVKTVATYVSRMKTYSDDGKTLHGAYGMRWRRWFPLHHMGGTPPVVDQLLWAIHRLKDDPNDRRVVIGMWDPCVDPLIADQGGKDVPCNTQLYVWIDTEGKLSMTVTCRSNDMIWGAHGANAVHFSYLMDYLACGVGVLPGRLYQVSNNYHAYTAVYDKLADVPINDPYDLSPAFCDPNVLYVGEPRQFDEDLGLLLDEGVTIGLRSAYLRKVVVPVMKAHEAYRNKADGERFATAREIMQQCKALDWRVACTQWLDRRQAEAERAKEDGPSHE
jgi:hypothetical protein